MKTYLISSIIALAMGSLTLASQALASDAPDTVVELFTSQGCSSCPPANKFVSSLADDPNKLVLSYGVTYWDYLGWEDTFGSPEFTKRQRVYGKAFRSGNIYTPQIVLNGSDHNSRYSKGDVAAWTLSEDRPEAVLENTPDGLVVKFNDDMDMGTVRLVLVSYMPGRHDVPVSRGENRGRTVSVSNVVRDIQTFDGQSVPDTGHVQTGLKPQSHLNYAVLVHDAQTSAILTAATYRPAS